MTTPGSRWIPALLGALLLTAGCTTGEGSAVDVNNGGEFRFEAGTPSGEVIPVDDRATAPEFSGDLLGGGDFDSADLSGEIVVLNFWGSWCAPCRAESPEFQEVYAEVRDRGVEFVGLNVKDPEQLAQAFVDTQGIEFPSVFDPRGEVALAFRDFPANAIPSTIVLDREYRVAAVYTARIPQEDLRTVLDRLLEEG
ncbi:TlpA family protein disulfide reductase [Trujillonella endophytica]|uniref:Peroxiredoxin n=1 Tax=Trujillonella endophytica TaxID=673521 RepID=A0A1H8RI68_9ACTN|nr:TlpA disulfide reductase family protein [Trujillella endophytica]SEO65947.1 Peroxiredoxin [Trujillella endophytica]